MLEVTVKLSTSAIIEGRLLRSARAFRRLRVTSVPRKGETLLIEYSYTDENAKEIEGHITPTVQDVSYLFPWHESGKQTEIILDCAAPMPIKELVMFEKAVEIWRAAEFDVTETEVEDDF